LFRKILVANRGEIALRIIRSAKEMGIKTVAIYSEADKESLHVQFADEAYCVGPAEQSKSYLNIPNIISSAIVSGADAIHPGYGFFAENAEFAEVCSDNGFRFIGPSKEAIALLGDKAQAKNLMQEAGVPVIPGSPGCICSLEEAMAFAREVGYPVIVKAAQGGGGRGMRVARNEGELKKAYDLARTEAEKAFESGEVYLEKYVENPRHIEVQILIDELGNGIYLGERECSLQRRHQKVLEESPSVAVSPELRQKMGEAAVRGALAAGYTNAGTMEFLLDSQGNFYFMDVNSWSFVSVEEARDAFGEGFLTPGNIPLGFELESITGTGTEDQVENVTLTYSESASSVDGLIRFITITQEKVASSWEYYGFEEVDLLGYTGYVSASEETAELHFFLGSVRYDVIGQLQKDQAIAIAKSMIQSTR
jgi:acetyl/propionyl-CoA carboxylase alpha subunit